MEYKTLGNTGLLVSTLCLGTMTFGKGESVYGAIGAVDRAGADEQVKTAMEAGVNFFDTAGVYCEGLSETTLGQSFRNLGVARKDVVIATEVYMRMGGGRNDIGLSRGHILDAVDASLRRLQTDHIDEVSAVDPIHPTWMMAAQTTGRLVAIEGGIWGDRLRSKETNSRREQCHLTRTSLWAAPDYGSARSAWEP